jgi:hypothetical protein
MYPQYGGREPNPVQMCDRWRNDFAAFLADMGKAPTDGHSVDRIDNERGYSPDNCRWATNKEQVMNRRVTLWLTVDGVTRTVDEWSTITGIAYRTLRHRIRSGWPPADCIARPVAPHKPYKPYRNSRTGEVAA